MKFKKILSSILALAMILSTMSFTAFAAEGDAVAQIGETTYATLKAALDAARDSKNITIDLLADATLDITAWSTLAIGSESTETITINGNSKTLTFNQLNSDWNNVATNGAKLILNNVTITNSGYNDGPWNRYDINFACDVELNNVVSTKALAFKAGATLNTVTVNENGDNYAIWIQANGQTVSIDGLTVNSAGRGIKIDEQYVEAKKVDLSVKNATFTTAKKSAILVKSAAGASISAENVNIDNVAADSTNLVWVDESGAATFSKVEVTGGDLAVEGGEESYAASVTSEDDALGYYKTLAEAFAAAKKGDTITLLNNVTLTQGIAITDQGVLSEITLDGNNKTITLDMNGSGYALYFYQWPTGVEIKNLTIEGSAQCAILLYGGESSKLTNVTVTGDYDDHYGAVWFYGTHGATLDNCHFVDGFSNGQAAQKLNLTNGTTIGTLRINDGATMEPKLFIDETSSITTVYADDHTAMIDSDSISRIGTIYEADSEATAMVASVNGVQYSTIQLAVKNANSGDTVNVIGNAADESVTVDKNLTITSDADNKQTLNNVSITLSGTTVELAVSNLKFTGSSYINANDGAALTVTNCEADVNPTKITGRAAFIVLGTGEPTHGLKLTVTNNNIQSAQSSTDPYSAAIFGWRYLANGSVISGNTFGSAEKPYTFIAVKTMNAMNGAIVTIENNTIYGTNKNWHFKGFDLYQNCSRDNTYLVQSAGNKFNIVNENSNYKANAVYLEGNPSSNVIFVDMQSNPSTVNGNKLTLADIDPSGLDLTSYTKYYGVGVTGTITADGKGIEGGTFGTNPGEEYCANGFEFVQNVDGTYGIQLKEDFAILTANLASTVDNKAIFDLVLIGGTEEAIKGVLAGEFNVELKGVTGDAKFEVTAAENTTFNLVDGKYYFNVTKADTDTEYWTEKAENIVNNTITLGQITVTGTGEDGAKGTINFSDEIIAKGFVGTEGYTNSKKINTITKEADFTITVPTQTLTIVLDMRHGVEELSDMSLTVTNVLGEVQTVDLTTPATEVEDANEENHKTYTYTVEVVKGGNYSVKISGKGYRSFTQTGIDMTKDTTVKLWNSFIKDGTENVVVDDNNTSVSTNFLAGDIIDDGIVNKFDLSAVVSYTGKTATSELVENDINRDGFINSLDTAIVVKHMGK